MTGRLGGLDVLRGLAVLLMVVDHSLIALGAPGSFWRFTLTRASLPLFCLVAGALMPATYRRPGRRWVELVAAATVATALGPVVGVGQPDVLVLFVVLLPAAPWLWEHWRLPAFCVAVIQPVTWPVGWTGYEPGTVLALVFAGAWVGAAALNRAMPASLVDQMTILPAIGRAPLRWYVGHVAVLWLGLALL